MRDDGHFPCQHAVELVTDYLEGTMEVDEKIVLERHLSWCDWCATYFEQMRETIRIAGSLREEDVPPPVLDSVMDAYRELRGSS